MRRHIVHFLWAMLLILLTLTAVFFVAVWHGWVGYMPDMEELSNPVDKFASQVYSSDGQLIGTWNQDNANRVAVDYNSLSPHLVHALVATEDERFYEHSGIDFIALGRAIIKRGVMRQQSAGGGSTITQQLAKQVFSEKAHSTLERLLQKPIEWIIAVKLERYFTKEEIVAMYLNYFDFLHNAVGIKRAANVYFNKEPQQLSVTQAATLVGLCKNPSLFNPLRYPQRCRQRRNVVLMQMKKCGYITHEEYNELIQRPLDIAYTRYKPVDGSADYFQAFLHQYMMAKKPERENYPEWKTREFTLDSIAWEQDPLYGWCNKNQKRNGENYDVNTDGLRIFTTIDTRMQQYAEKAVRKHVGGYLQAEFNKANRYKRNAPFSDNISRTNIKAILNRACKQSVRYRQMKEMGASDEEIVRSFRTPHEMTLFTYHGNIDTLMTPIDSIRYYKSFLRAAFMSMDVRTGAVKAYVGGIDYEHFKYDMVMGGRRQVGSTIKPYLYALAMQNGMTPCSTAPNVQRTYGGWTPRNTSRARYGQQVTLRWGLQQSNNWISAYLINLLGPSQFVNILHDFGFNNPDIDKNTSPVLCLGPSELSVGEMCSAYTTFANRGVRCAPLFVTKIEDSHGNVIAKFQPLMNEVISQESAYKMLDMLQAVIDGGTGGRLRYRFNIEGPVGGKTGTTNNNSDGWFMAFTPQLVSGCWVGGEDRDIHFDNTAMGQGATMALPIWAYYMQQVYADPRLGYTPESHFEIPSSFNPCESVDSVFVNGIQEIYF
ncbi:penicillin-binding protein [Prevotella brunnea]|uniref:Penicillin-binding protein n=1 Tax=Prevotella brunnea TaxID=2508867 RepID=A0A5C8GB13_9BACT|nr:transglycosylase domain-containing protein [Prevotella brunnea]MDR0185001.1 penicillin-binding protein [Prevotella brunnea]TXJ59066.1 penicillin-binding protein [Prevotella brunnea]